MDQPAVGMARCIPRHRRDWLYLAPVLANVLSEARGAPKTLQSGTGLHPERPTRNCASHQVGQPGSTSADLGIRGWKIPYRSGVVVLSFLDAWLLPDKTWPLADANRASTHRDLCNRGHWQRCRRLDLFLLDSAWTNHQRVPQDCHADLCCRCHA